MSIGTRAKRLIYLIHRWTGVAACVLMALWFVSGMVMLFIGYPKLTPWERLGALAPLSTQNCCISVDDARSVVSQPETLRSIVLTSIRHHPYYRMRRDDGRYVLVDAINGKQATVIDANAVLAEARRFVPDAQAHYEGEVAEDRWTHSRALDPHRPLHMVQMDDAAHTRLYLSSTTGEVVMDAPRAQRAWNYVGAWLHWLYYFRDRAVDPGWSWIVIILSAFATITAITGTIAGIWRWRFSGRYKSGSHSPYREPYLRWHHITGLLFAAIIFTWIFSGLMSMNPFGIFNAQGARPDLAAYRNGNPVTTHLSLPVPRALSLLEKTGFQAVEIEWHILNGQPYILARNAAAATRLIVHVNGELAVREQWDVKDLMQAATRLLPAKPKSHQLLHHYDRYYYARQPEAMMGAAERRLPVLRIDYADQHATQVYLDLYTGDVALSMDDAQRAGRWLFSFLHSWDLPLMLKAGIARDAVLLLLSLGGLAMSLTGIVIGYGRVKKWIRRTHRKPM